MGDAGSRHGRLSRKKWHGARGRHALQENRRVAEHRSKSVRAKLQARDAEAQRFRNGLSEADRRLLLTPDEKLDAVEARARSNMLAAMPNSELTSDDRRRQDARAAERDRDRGRRRPLKHAPSSVTFVAICTVDRGEGDVVLRRARPGDAVDFIDDERSLDSGSAERIRIEPDLARRAQALRAALDIKAPEDFTFEQHFIHRDFVAAIDQMCERLALMWLPRLLKMIDTAVIAPYAKQKTKLALARGRRDKRALREADADAAAIFTEPVRPAEIKVALDKSLAPLGVLAVVPEHITVSVIKWALDRYTPSRGGGRPRRGEKSGRLSREALEKALRDPSALRHAMRGPNSRR